MNIVYMTPELEDSILSGVNPYSDEGQELFRTWCEENEAYYYSYADGNSDISRAKAIARLGGYKSILVEDSS